MITERREKILKVVVDEYISRGVPVASETVARRGLGVSPATIRNEMNELEEEGYLCQPHTSAGRVPSDKGYRHYVESLTGDIRLPLGEQRLIYHQFHQVEREIEEWTRLAAAILCRTLRNVAIVTLPKSAEPRLQRLELVSLQELLVLLLLVFKETKIRQQVLPLDESVSQEELDASSRKLNAAYVGLARPEISAKSLALSLLEEQVVKAITQVMQAEESEEYEAPYVDGLRHILNQPELTSGGMISAIVEVLEEKSLLKSLLPRVLTGEGVRVVIGSESRERAMRGCSVVVTRYGIPGEVGGAIGVVGPTRMQYSRAIPTVSFLSTVMSELLTELYR